MNEAEYLMKNYGDCVIRRGRRPRRITPSEISIILHMIRKPNSIVVLSFIQNNSQFKNMAKTCSPPSIHRCYVHLQVCPAPQIFSKQQMSSFELSSCCSFHVFSYFFRVVLTLETSEMSAIFSRSQPKQLNLVPRSSWLTVP